MHFLTCLWNAWTYFNQTYHSYSLHYTDIDDILKVMVSKVMITDQTFPKNALYRRNGTEPVMNDLRACSLLCSAHCVINCANDAIDKKYTFILALQ